MSAGFLERHGSVYYYVPNLIGSAQMLPWPASSHYFALTAHLTSAGYARLLSAIGAFGLARSSPTATVALYLVG